MTSIGAIFSRDEVQRHQIETMRSCLGELPHDESRVWLGRNMGLAACTLHTASESHEGTQPCVSADGQLAAIFAGYLLNPTELSSELAAKGEQLRNGSDVEIALRAYEAWGEGCADRLHGEFALIVADMRAGKLFAANDHMGLVPLYYREENGGIILATDFRTLAALSHSPLTADKLFLAQAITNRWFLRDNTPWAQIKRLVRAHTLRFDGNRLDLNRYWLPPCDIRIRYKSDAEYAEHYREVLFDCTRRASRSHQKVGIAVSGGLDSSALFLVGDQLERDGAWLAPGLSAYTLAAEEGENSFELPYARAAASHAGRGLVEVPLFDPGIDWYTRDANWHCDIPIPSNGAMMLDMEKQVVADGSRVIINGVGGDQWLCGNNLDYREYWKERDFQGFLAAFNRDCSEFGVLQTAKFCARHLAGELIPADLRQRIRAGMRERGRDKDVAFSLLVPELREAMADAEEAYEAQMPVSAVDWAKHNLATTPFSDLSYSLMRRQRDLIGVESRHPMLSRAFIEFSLRTPTHIKRRGKLDKVVHRNAMAGLLPDAILNRTTKANFTNAGIDAQFAAYVRKHAPQRLREICDLERLSSFLELDFTTTEGDYWAWEIWGLYASAAFLYENSEGQIPTLQLGVQPDRN